MSWQPRLASAAAVPAQSAAAGRGAEAGVTEQVDAGGEGEKAEAVKGDGKGVPAHEMHQLALDRAHPSSGVREDKGQANEEAEGRAWSGLQEAQPAAAALEGAVEGGFGVEYMFALADTVTGQVSVPPLLPVYPHVPLREGSMGARPLDTLPLPPPPLAALPCRPTPCCPHAQL